MPVLESIHIYPIKATRGIALEEAYVERAGLANDRRWMLVDGWNTFLSQRDVPRLALVSAQVLPSRLQVQAPGMEPLAVAVPEAVSPRLSVRLWKDVVSVVPAGEGADAWFGRYLGSACRLVYMDAQAVRPVDPRYAASGDTVTFADGYPLLLTLRASLEALNVRLEHPVPMDRFRPNVVVSGGAAFDEDGWRQIRIGDVPFRVVKPCERCAVTTVDQRTAEQGKEPLRALSAFRRRAGAVYFGQNLIPVHPGRVRVGDPVIVEA